MAYDFQPLMDAMVSHLLTLGVFERVNDHEPKNSPGNGITAAVTVGNLGPARGQSGLASTSVLYTPQVRIYVGTKGLTPGQVEAYLMSACSAVFTAYTGDFTLDGLIRDIDILGMCGVPLSSRPGWIEQSTVQYRITDITVPLIINDVFDQAP